MPSRSPAQHRLMAAVAHDPAFAKKVGIPVSVGKDFVKADQDRKFADGGWTGKDLSQVSVLPGYQSSPWFKDKVTELNEGAKSFNELADAALAEYMRSRKLSGPVQSAMSGKLADAYNPGGIIKAPGGNWLAGSVEDALKGLKTFIPDAELVRLAGMNPDNSGRVAATSLNTFIQGPLTRYVKNQMATVDDPVRALAEKGTLHVAPEQLHGGRSLVHPSGEVLEKLGQSATAKSWENASDRMIAPDQARTFLHTKNGDTGIPTVEKNPWLAKVPPETPVYDLYAHTRPEDLGFNHLTDELRNALNPESGLPRNLLLTPEKMQQMGIEKAVRHVDAINKWRAAQEAEANMQKANNAATVLHKEYPHTPETPNPKGLRWVELKAPEAVLEEGHAPGPVSGYPNLHGIIDQRTGQSVSLGATPEEALKLYKRKDREALLSDALKYEGDTMKHCVGGYCPDVAEGRSRIFSLRDAKGEPHVTIETRPGDQFASRDRLMELPTEDYRKISKRAEELLASGDYGNDLNAALTRATNEALGEPASRIIQIKGKSNSKPKDEYLPFVQDFVKSGKWSDVGDLGNTGLVRKSSLGPEVATHPSDYLTMEEVQKLREGKPWQPIDNSPELDLPNDLLPRRAFATGGRVSMIHPAAAIQPLVHVPGFDT